MHAPKNIINQYRDRYTKGWEALRQQRFEKQRQLGRLKNVAQLPPIDPTIAKFDTVTNPSLWIDKMATYAAMIQVMDEGIGKIIQKIKDLGEWKNTLFIFLSDNGGCHEILDDRSIVDLGEEGYKNSLVSPVGSKGSYTTYGREWASASNTPFRMYKHWMHEGGISTPLLVYYPKLIKKGFQTDQVGHIMDLFPTIMELTQTKSNQSVEGKSLVPLLKKGKKAIHKFIAWEHQGNRAIREGDWKLVWDAEIKKWELYNLKIDRIEANDLANRLPEKRKDLLTKYNQWALEMGVQ